MIKAIKRPTKYRKPYKNNFAKKNGPDPQRVVWQSKPCMQRYTTWCLQKMALHTLCQNSFPPVETQSCRKRQFCKLNIAVGPGWQSKQGIVKGRESKQSCRLIFPLHPKANKAPLQHLDSAELTQHGHQSNSRRLSQSPLPTILVSLPETRPIFMQGKMMR